MNDTIPVTILSGSLGAGKTTLVNHLLSTAGDHDLAVLVNDMGEVNIDAELVAEGSELDLDDGVTELSNGCICCELQDDLETAVVRLAQDRSFDHLLVESSGISEPAPVARLFTTESRVAALYGVDALVTVLDTPRFLDCFGGESVPERRGEEGDRPLSDLLVDQVEVSNIVLLNKADQCTDEELTEAEALVGALQPDAETVRTEFSVIDPGRLLAVDRFETQAVAELPGWKRALKNASDSHDHDHGGDHEHEADHGESHDHDHNRDHGDDHDHAAEDGHDQDHDHDHDHGDDHDHKADHGDGHDHESDHGDSHDHDHDHYHPDEVYGVTSFTYRRRRPLHPERFAAFLESLPPTIIRAKGTAWIAGNETRISVSQAGPSVRATGQGPWIASLPEVDREMYRSNRPDLAWHDDHGDRRTELVFIGTEYDEQELRGRLADAALTDTELEAVENQQTANSPFPADAGDETVIRTP